MLALGPSQCYRKLWNLFDDFFPGKEVLDLRGEVPHITFEETEDAYLFRAEMPGVPKDKLEISVKERIATVKTKEEAEEKDESGKVRKRSYRQYSAVFSIPGNFKAEGMKAESVDGILTMTFPKAEEAKPRQITVQ